MSSYKPERFYWEIIISTRKVAIVALSVFGAELGPQRQCQIALLLLLGFLVLEIAGDPYREVTPEHSVLRKLELVSLLLEWTTFWCGLMIYQSNSDSISESEFTNVFLTMYVVIGNIMLILWFLFVLIGAYVKLRCFGPKSGLKMLRKCLSMMKKKATKNFMKEEVKWAVNPTSRAPELEQLELVVRSNIQRSDRDEGL